MNTNAALIDNGLDGLNARNGRHGRDGRDGGSGRGYDPCREALSPERGLARNLQKMASNAGHPASLISLDELTALLEAQNEAAANGDLSHVRRMLSNQVTMLERLTDHLFSRALGMGAVVDVYERYLRLAFRAQAQCVRTATLLKKLTEAAGKVRKVATVEDGAGEWEQGNEKGLVQREPDICVSGHLEKAGNDEVPKGNAHPTLGREALATSEG